MEPFPLRRAEESRVLTKDVWGRLTAILDAEGIPYVPSQGAMFCWVDMR